VKIDVPRYDAHGKLWLAVLRLAVADATTDLPPPTKQQGETLWQRRARLWMVTTRRTPGSLNWICDVLNLNPDVIRDEVKRRMDDAGVPLWRRTRVHPPTNAPVKPDGRNKPHEFRGNQHVYKT
jgi:hypothetical protein